MSIAAMTWAFTLPLKPSAKVVLLAIADFADENGVCWPSLSTLAERATQSRATVQRRVGEMQDLGILTRFERRREDGGRASDELRLNLALTAADLANFDDARSDDDDNSAGDPPYQIAMGGGSTPDTPPSHSCDGPPSHSCDPHKNHQSEPTPPLPPSGGRERDLRNDDLEGFAEMWVAYPGHEIMKRSRAEQVWSAMTPEEREHARLVVPLLAETYRRLHRKAIENCDRWLARKGWKEFTKPAAAPVLPARRWVAEGGAEFAARQVAAMIAGVPPPPTIDDRERGRGLWLRGDPPPDLIALAAFADQQHDDWSLLEDGSAQFAAWRDRLEAWLGTRVEPQRVWLEPYIAGVHDLPAMHEGFRLRRGTHGLRAPVAWPPRRDGTWSAQAPPAVPVMTDDDVAVLAREG